MKLLMQTLLLSLSITTASAAAVKDDCQQGCGDTLTETADTIASKWGVGDFVVRISGAGYMLDIRYRVLDSKKAVKIFDRKAKPYVIQESTGHTFTVPSNAKVGFMRQKPKHIEDNKMYFIMVANPARRIQAGEKITLVIGEVKIPGLAVQ